MINRAAVTLRYKEPGIEWINAADPYPGAQPLTLESINQDRTVYLISDEDGDDDQSFETWLNESYLALFETELEGWYTDESLWPEDRTREVFDSWFTVELNTVLVDTVGGEIYDDET